MPPSGKSTHWEHTSRNITHAKTTLKNKRSSWRLYRLSPDQVTHASYLWSDFLSFPLLFISNLSDSHSQQNTGRRGWPPPTWEGSHLPCAFPGPDFRVTHTLSLKPDPDPEEGPNHLGWILQLISFFKEKIAPLSTLGLTGLCIGVYHSRVTPHWWLVSFTRPRSLRAVILFSLFMSPVPCTWPGI